MHYWEAAVEDAGCTLFGGAMDGDAAAAAAAAAAADFGEDA